ncbi:restriction endonuclease-like protein [Caenibacillus caldisaponilyticus]|uniref:DUF2357 domain-containing protein n=1 Tax=Caenibacillus caldisaponilyticus TaxID=1674942 RepID=UPI000988557F|nr:restriction endonuclease-like protein [Caenibacillus caldisaponilyticus]
MASRPSGSEDFVTQLVVIETSELFLYIKGIPYHERYESLKQYRQKAEETFETMRFECTGVDVESVEVFDVREGCLMEKGEHPPIFFENGFYQLVVESKQRKRLYFDHEYPALRKAVGPVGKDGHILMGNLRFTNEIGLTTFQIHDGIRTLLEVTLEIFPSKLDYKEDFYQLLKEVNEEIYNLAFHFLRKTFLGASSVPSSRPSPTEFYRLFDHYVHQFFQAIDRIERQPHHKLVTRYLYVRGDRIKQMDPTARKRIRKKAHLFEETPGGLDIAGHELLPRKGWTVRKDLSFDTLENRFVKWMISRLRDKTAYIYKKLAEKGPYEKAADPKLLNKVSGMQRLLENRFQMSFWKTVGKLDRSVMSLVLHMKPGYREAYRIYLIVSRGLALLGQMFKMSVKDVATLYEYWTYLKLGQILGRKYEPVSQDIVKVKRDGLYVDLDQTKSAKRVFRHPATGEKIVLEFQARDKGVPTVPQKPDVLLSIEKKDRPYPYNYVFDAKYRIDFASAGSYYDTVYHSPGPLEADINTMHRYRDALVARQGGPYERYAFGAYVLFPWNDELGYRSHHFYKSIDEVNIGGLPFLPNATSLVEQFIERLIDKSAEEIQEEGILPLGATDYWRSSLEEKVLVGNVNGLDRYHAHMRHCFYHIPVRILRSGWQEARYVALYIPQKVSTLADVANGITYYGKIIDTELVKRSDIKEIPSRNQEYYVRFRVDGWRRLDHTIGPVGYGIVSYMMTTLNMLKKAYDLPELFIKSEEELALWRMLRRFSRQIRIDLDNRSVDLAKRIKAYKIRDLTFTIDEQRRRLAASKQGKVLKTFNLEELRKRPSTLFREISTLLYDG